METSSPLIQALAEPAARTVGIATSSRMLLITVVPVDERMRRSGDPAHGPNDIQARIPILMYHHIRRWRPTYLDKERQYTVEPEYFAAQMESLARAGFHAIQPQDLVAALHGGRASLPSKPVLLTFDDGYVDQYRQAFPVLRRLRLHATFFVVSGLLGRADHFGLRELRALDQSGLITIAAHTRRHVPLARVSMRTRVDEISGSKRDLENLLHHPVPDFAYPYGSWNATVARLVQAAGFDDAFGVRWGSLHVPQSRYDLRRIQVFDREDIVPMLEAYLTNKPRIGN